MYFIVLLFCVYFRLELDSDNLNYFNIYDNIKSDTLPFGAEIGVSSLMYFFNILGADFYLYTFFKLLLFLPVFIKIDYVFFKNRLYLSSTFLISTLYPPFLDMMIFLSRQSLSITFILLCLLTESRKKSIFWFVIAVCSHLSAFIFLPVVIFYKEIYRFLINKYFQSLILIYMLCGLKYQTLSSFILENINNNINVFPEIIKRNILMKTGFYDWNSNSDFDGFSYLRLTVMIIISLMVILLFNHRAIYTEIEKKLLCIYLYSALLFTLTVDNYMMATRSGFFSYFFCLPWFFIVLCFIKKLR
ncbi:EpsG family protein [Acinetobacter sp. B10A]|nr:EpsG family protein [Acinetobacter baretiae]